MAAEDCEVIASAFSGQNWDKPIEQFERYLQESWSGKRTILIAEVEGDLAGYETIDWEPDYPFFKESLIPEIADLNVLIKFQKRGVGSELMDAAENMIRERCNTAGVRVGLDPDYGIAHRLYVKRGYVPDGLGSSQRGKFLKYGDTVTVDDELTIALIKSLK
jgi:GNAT superfamily N-acetyltransferase